MQIEILERDLGRSLEIYNTHMCRDFPENERKPWEITSMLYEKGIYDFLEVYAGVEMVGYAWIACPQGKTALIDYLAVLPEYRGTGVGSEILKCLCERYRMKGKSLILESEYPDEAPDPQIAVRRLGFYVRAGFLDSGVQVRLFGVKFIILSHGITGNEKDEMAHIYRAMFPGSLYKKSSRISE